MDHDHHAHHPHDDAHAGHGHGAAQHVGHGHHHGGPGHSHAPASFGSAFAIGIGLNALFVIAEVVFGVFGHSVALLADAGHNLSDVLGLVVAWGASVLARRAPDHRFTYGLGSSSILAALFNAVFLLVVVGGLSWEAIGRLWRPEPVAGVTVMVVAAIGIAINGFCAFLFASGRKGDLNVRGAFAHMLADAVVSAGVVVAGLVILLTGWVWLDPVVSLVVNALIVYGTWTLLRDSATMALGAVPPGIDTARVRRFLSDRPGVASPARPAHLADQHHRNRVDGPHTDAGRSSRRRRADEHLLHSQGRLRHRACHAADRDRYDDGLCFGRPTMSCDGDGVSCAWPRRLC